MARGFVRGFLAAVALGAAAACGGSSDPAFAITSVVPARGTTLGGTAVVVSGRGFGAAATVTFDGLPATGVVVVSASEIRCVTPAHPSGAVVVAVANSASETKSAPVTFAFDAPPAAIARWDQIVTAGAAVALDGSASADPDSTAALAYAWTLSAPLGSAAALSGASTASPSFTADVAGTYVATLVVNDGTSDSPAASVTVRTSATASGVPDTALAECTGASATVPCPAEGATYFGQDASYQLRPPRYAITADTALDEVTGLTWERADEGQYNWFEAAGRFDAVYNAFGVDVCGALARGGFSDWRLPSAHELYSLLYLANPAAGDLDRVAFPGLGGGTYWTSTERGTELYNPPAQVALPTSSYGYGHRMDPMWVVCVRGPAYAVNAYVDRGDGTVRDDGTALVWEQTPPAVAYNWRSALARCEALSLGGRDDWRLPNAKELQTIAFPIDLAAFPGTQAGDYWTSTPIGPAVLTVDFSVDMMDSAIPAASLFTRCVQ